MRFTEDLKEQIRIEFVQGLEDERGQRKYPTIEHLVQAHEIPKTTLYRYAKEEGWKDQRKTFQDGLLQKMDEQRQITLVEHGKKLDSQSITIAETIMGAVSDQLKCLDDLSGHQVLALSNAALSAQKLAKLALGESTDNMSINANVRDSRAFKSAFNLLDKLGERKRETSS